jgi:hypothetical protein
MYLLAQKQETQSWCVIKRIVQYLFRHIAEKGDHTQENEKSFAKKVFSKGFYPRTELSGGQK